MDNDNANEKDEEMAIDDKAGEEEEEEEEEKAEAPVKKRKVVLEVLMLKRPHKSKEHRCNSKKEKGKEVEDDVDVLSSV